jgi:hypothetical protein
MIIEIDNIKYIKYFKEKGSKDYKFSDNGNLTYITKRGSFSVCCGHTIDDSDQLWGNAYKYKTIIKETNEYLIIGMDPEYLIE